MRNAAASGATCAVKFGSKKNGTLEGDKAVVSVITSSTVISCVRGGVARVAQAGEMVDVRNPVVVTSMDNPVQCRLVHPVCPRLPHLSDIANYAPRHWASGDPYSMLGTCSLGVSG